MIYHLSPLDNPLIGSFREDLYGLAHVAGRGPCNLHNLVHYYHMVKGLDLYSTYYTDPAQHLITVDTGSTVDDLHDLYHLHDLHDLHDLNDLYEPKYLDDLYDL